MAGREQANPLGPLCKDILVTFNAGRTPPQDLAPPTGPTWGGWSCVGLWELQVTQTFRPRAPQKDRYNQSEFVKSLLFVRETSLG